MLNEEKIKQIVSNKRSEYERSMAIAKAKHLEMLETGGRLSAIKKISLP